MSKPGVPLPPGSVRENPEACPSGIRHVGGAKLNQALVRNVRTCRSDAKGDVQAAHTARTRVPKRSTGYRLKTMTDDLKRSALELPAEIIAELHAHNAKHLADCDGFNDGKFQLWATTRGPLLVLLTPHDDEVVFFRPLGSSSSRSPRNLGRILREQDNDPDNPVVENSSLEPINADSDRSKNWEQFEERVQYIYSILLNIKGEKVSVFRDFKTAGRDGLVHQFDVYYEFTRAGVNHRVAIECRDKSRPLDKDAVMAFRSKVSDIPGLLGLMVSAK